MADVESAVSVYGINTYIIISFSGLVLQKAATDLCFGALGGTFNQLKTIKEKLLV